MTEEEPEQEELQQSKSEQLLQKRQLAIREQLGSVFLAIGITVLIATTLTVFSTIFLSDYGGSLFLLLPLICGMVSVLIYNRKEQRTFKQSLILSLMACCISLLGFFVVGLEGAICIIMAAPVMFPMFLIGGIIGHWISRNFHHPQNSDIASMILVALVPISMGVESTQTNQAKQSHRKVVTKVIITGKVEEVWKEVIEFSPIPKPQEFLFRIGIAYPTHAEIEGTGVGAIRYCHFSTGAFVEPITQWDENKKLAFNVSEQPLPMTEVSPYVGIHPPHLDWAVRSQKGEFVLNDLGDGTVELIGTTWYTTVMKPEPYWGWWSDHMIHIVHQRVLDHIKNSVEHKPVP